MAGGDGPCTQVTELYDPATETWSSAPDLLAPRARQTAFLDATGEVVLAGGIASSYEAVATAEAYGRTLPVIASSG